MDPNTSFCRITAPGHSRCPEDPRWHSIWDAAGRNLKASLAPGEDAVVEDALGYQFVKDHPGSTMEMLPRDQVAITMTLASDRQVPCTICGIMFPTFSEARAHALSDHLAAKPEEDPSTTDRIHTRGK